MRREYLYSLALHADRRRDQACWQNLQALLLSHESRIKLSSALSRKASICHQLDALPAAGWVASGIEVEVQLLDTGDRLASLHGWLEDPLLQRGQNYVVYAGTHAALLMGLLHVAGLVDAHIDDEVADGVAAGNRWGV